MLHVQRDDLVAGGGTMGRGIAQVLAQCGVRTLVFDAKPGAAQQAKDSIGKTLAVLAQKGRHSFYLEPRYRPSPWLARRVSLGLSLLTPE